MDKKYELLEYLWETSRRQLVVRGFTQLQWYEGTLVRATELRILWNTPQPYPNEHKLVLGNLCYYHLDRPLTPAGNDRINQLTVQFYPPGNRVQFMSLSEPFNIPATWDRIQPVWWVAEKPVVIVRRNADDAVIGTLGAGHLHILPHLLAIQAHLENQAGKAHEKQLLRALHIRLTAFRKELEKAWEPLTG